MLRATFCQFGGLFHPAVTRRPAFKTQHVLI
ncbi:MAG: hypothetical protein ACI861_000991, partial [Paracoccaceae bacterium]